MGIRKNTSTVSKADKQASQARKDSAVIHHDETAIVHAQPVSTLGAMSPMYQVMRQNLGERKPCFYYKAWQSGTRHLIIVASSSQPYVNKDGDKRQRKVYHVLSIDEFGNATWAFDNGGTLGEVYAYVDVHFGVSVPKDEREDGITAGVLGTIARQKHQEAKPAKRPVSPQMQALRDEMNNLKAEAKLRMSIDKAKALLAEVDALANPS